MRLNTIPIALIIVLYSSLCVAEVDPAMTALLEDSLKQIDEEKGERIPDYPVKGETTDELSQRIDKFNDLQNDIQSLQVQSAHDTLVQTLLLLYLAKSSEPVIRTNDLLTLEIMHDIFMDYRRSALYFIKDGASKTALPNLDTIAKNIDDLVIFESQFPSSNHSLVVVLLDKLKERTRESKRLIQKIIVELGTTIRRIEANESNP
tara:strand:+ start:291 stop:905 length:615 start_codon:yes stop_codon:yes gene_type:complete